MARVKISEYRAKTLLNDYMGSQYFGFYFDSESDDIAKLDEMVDEDKRYVIKVDQAVKKRFKQGLVKLDLNSVHDMVGVLSEFRRKGYRYSLIEELLPHEDNDERYISIERTALGNVVNYSSHGGIDIEDHSDEVKSVLIKDNDDLQKIAVDLGVDRESFLEKLLEAFDIYYFSFLEINPLVVSFKTPYMLDIAGEVDSSAEFFVSGWNSSDFRYAAGIETVEEENVKKLSEKSSSSLALKVLNPNGSIFMLLSGGGVSVALADEVANLGKGDLLANYGEYSGNPTEEETYIYTQNILSLMLKSDNKKKVLIIGGGVANFTDIRITFKGVVKALSEVKGDLKDQGIKVFVRRGGPHQDEGLSNIKKFLIENDLIGVVAGPEMILPEVVHLALEEIK